VKQFSYLGSTISEDCKSHIEIRRRIILGKEAFSKNNEIMRGKLELNLKKRLIKTLIWSVVLYGSETWTLLKEDIKRLEAFEMWIWRRIMKVKWTEHKANEEVLEMVKEKRMLMKTIRVRQKNWVGHVLRSDSLLRTVWEGRMEGKKVAGRPRTQLLDWMIRETDTRTYEDLKKLALDRKRCRTWDLGPV
jgi:hypothetical protein